MTALILVIIGLVAIAVEFLTISTFFIWIAFGLWAAAITALVTTNVYVITIVGLVVGIGSAFGFRSNYIAYANKTGDTKTSYESHIGTSVVLLGDYEPNETNHGEIKLNGVVWSARSVNQEVKYVKDEVVTIVDIKGNFVYINKK